MHCTENEMWSNLFLNVHWPLSQGAMPQLSVFGNLVVHWLAIEFTYNVTSSGGPPFCHHARRCVGGDQEVHARPHSHFGEERRAYPRGHQAVLHKCGARGGLTYKSSQ